MVYIVIVTFNASRWIVKSINSFAGSHGSDYRIIIVDNGSTDDTIDIVKGFRDDRITILSGHGNIGFGKGNNLGIQLAMEANADFVLLLNQDAWFEGNGLQALVDAAVASPEFGLVSPMHFNGSGTELDAKFLRYIQPVAGRLIEDLLRKKASSDVYAVDYVNAAAWLLTRRCIEKVGLFEPLFFMYGEDDNYLHRIHYKNFKVGVTLTSIIFHDRPVPRKTATNTRAWQAKRRIRLLVNLLDINRSFRSCLARQFRLEAAEFWKGIFKLRFNRSKIAVGNIAFLFYNYRRLRRRRYAHKQGDFT